MNGVYKKIHTDANLLPGANSAHERMCRVLHMCKFAWCANSRHVNANTHLSKFALRVNLHQVWRSCKSIFVHVQICMYVISVM